MIIFDTLQTALVQLGANKLRTGLTMLGIVIGVGAVIALMAAGQGAQQGVTKEVSALGSNLLFVEPGQTEQGGGPVRFSATTLTTDDADAIKSLQYVDAVISQFDLRHREPARRQRAQHHSQHDRHRAGLHLRP